MRILGLPATVVGAFVAVIVASVTLQRGLDIQARYDGVRSADTVAEAIVTRKNAEGPARSYTYWLTYEFRTEDGEKREDRQRVSRERYSNLKPGASLEARYQKEAPRYSAVDLDYLHWTAVEDWILTAVLSVAAVVLTGLSLRKAPPPD